MPTPFRTAKLVSREAGEEPAACQPAQVANDQAAAAGSGPITDASGMPTPAPSSKKTCPARPAIASLVSGRRQVTGCP
jgi:hypothetical protein